MEIMNISPARRFALVSVTMLLLICGNSLAATARSLKPRAEVGLGVGKAVWLKDYRIEDTPIDTIRITGGYIIASVLELEAYAAVTSWGNSSEGIYFDTSGNIKLNLPVSQRFIPFASIGLGVELRSLFYLWNYAAGVRIGLTDRLGIRAEYRSWSVLDVYDIYHGISYTDFFSSSVSIGLAYLF